MFISLAMLEGKLCTCSCNHLWFNSKIVPTVNAVYHYKLSSYCVHVYQAASHSLFLACILLHTHTYTPTCNAGCITHRYGPQIHTNIFFSPCSRGASVALEDLRYLPTAFQQVIFNPICIFRHIHIQESPLNWGSENVCDYNRFELCII